MEKYAFYSATGHLKGILTIDNGKFSAENRTDSSFSDFINTLVEIEKPKNLYDLVKNGFSYLTILDVTEDSSVPDYLRDYGGSQ